MRISNKKKQEILDAVKDEIMATLKLYPEFDNAPDMWNRDQVKVFDEYSELEHRICRRLETAFSS